MFLVELEMEPLLEMLGFKYDKRRGEWFKYKNYFMETIIFYDYTLGTWEGYLAFRDGGIISSRGSLEGCLDVINSRYEELERTLEELNND